MFFKTCEEVQPKPWQMPPKNSLVSSHTSSTKSWSVEICYNTWPGFCSLSVLNYLYCLVLGLWQKCPGCWCLCAATDGCRIVCLTSLCPGES